MNGEEFFGYVQDIFEDETYPLLENYVSDHQVNDSIWYNIDSNERPLASSITYMIADKSDVPNPEALSAVSQLSFAMGLAQDDIADEEVERRGMDPAYREFGTGNVLRGLMHGNAEILDIFIGEDIDKDVIRAYSDNVKDVYKATEDAEENDISRDLDELRRIDTDKVSFVDWPANGLFDGEERENLMTYTRELAFAGQLLNDLQDVYSPQMEPNRDKEEGNDVVEGRVNFVIGLLYDSLEDQKQQTFRELYEPGMDQTKVNFVVDSAQEVELREQVEGLIDESIENAVSSLNDLENQEHNEALKAYADLFEQSHRGR